MTLGRWFLAVGVVRSTAGLGHAQIDRPNLPDIVPIPDIDVLPPLPTIDELPAGVGRPAKQIILNATANAGPANAGPAHALPPHMYNQLRALGVPEH